MDELIQMQSNRSGNNYTLKILKEKHKEEYRICNLTKGHICPCIFNTYEEAYNDILKYQQEGKMKLIKENGENGYV